MKTVRYISWALVAVMTIVFGVLLYQGFEEAGQPNAIALGGPFELVNEEGEVFTHENLAGKPYAIFFGFTHCPEICPTTLAEMDGWVRQLGPKADGMEFLFVTVDPERDTPELLKSYISSFDPRITALSGTPENVQTMVEHYKVYAKKVPLDDGDYTMDHTASIFLINGQGGFAGTIAYGENHETAFAKLARLAESAR